MSRPKPKYCLKCSRLLDQNKRGTKKFCNDSCRVMHNRNKDKPTPMEKMIERQQGNATCYECRERYYRKSDRGMYCSDKCKMRAYRRERAS